MDERTGVKDSSSDICNNKENNANKENAISLQDSFAKFLKNKKKERNFAKMSPNDRRTEEYKIGFICTFVCLPSHLTYFYQT